MAHPTLEDVMNTRISQPAFLAFVILASLLLFTLAVSVVNASA
jgi:hypothetical protein